MPTITVTAEEVLKSRMIADPHTSMMCAAVGSGAAVAILTTVENAIGACSRAAP